MVKKQNGKVTFTFDGDSNETVYLVGDFNRWDAKANPMMRQAGKWACELALKPGQYQFRYRVGQRWLNDHKADKYVRNPFGEDNSVVVVEGKPALAGRSR